MVSIKEIANYIVSYFSTIATNSIEGDLTNLKLQKLLYYCQLESLKRNNEPLFNEAIEAWNYGPVIPSVYQEYKKFGRNILETTKPNLLLNPDEVKVLVDNVIETKGQYTGIALMRMTHEENAWKKAFKSQDRIISLDLIKQSIVA